MEFPSITVTSSSIRFCLWNRSCGPRLALSPPNSCPEFLFVKNRGQKLSKPEVETTTALAMRGFIFIIPCIFSKLSSFSFTSIFYDRCLDSHTYHYPKQGCGQRPNSYGTDLISSLLLLKSTLLGILLEK